MSQGSEESRAAEQSTYLQIFEQFFDQADGLCSPDHSYIKKLPANSQFPHKKHSTDLTSNFHHECSAALGNTKNRHHESNCVDDNTNLHNSENVLKKISTRASTTMMRRGMLKRQNGFNEEDGRDDGVDDDGGVQESVFDHLDDEVFEDGKQNNIYNKTNITSNPKKSNRTNKSITRNNKSKSNKIDSINRRTSVPLQSINIQDNYNYNYNTTTPPNYNHNPNPRHKPHKKSQSFKHACTKYYYYPEPNNARISLVLPNKPRRFKNSNCTDTHKSTSVKALENHTKQRHHSFEQSNQHVDPAQKKLQLVRLMQDLDCTVVRSFVTSAKGVVNRGDSFRKKIPQVTPDLVVGCLPYLQDDESSLIGRNDSIDLLASSGPNQSNKKLNGLKQASEPLQTQAFNVLVLGDQSVGKTSLLQQFITSEFMASADPVFDKEFEKKVSVQVDDQETTLAFVDLPIYVQKKGLPYSETDAFLVCYSITDRESFEWAVEAVQAIRQRSEAALILVANKSDLVRSRKVGFEESRVVCQKHNCKFVEVSAAFNHRVDELLVGLVHQIRLNPTRQRAKSVPNTTGSTLSTDSLLSSKSSPSAGCFRGARVFLTGFILGFRKTKSRSCDNLWTL